MEAETTGMRPCGRRPRFERIYLRPGHRQHGHAFIHQPIAGIDGREDVLRASAHGPRETLSGIAFRIVT